GRSLRMLGVSLAVALAATAGLFFVRTGDWLMGAVLFGVGNVGASAGFVFYDSLLPHVARDDEMDRVSSAGYALGYLGGGLLLAANLAWILKPAWFGLSDAGVATRLSFVSVAIWWLGFSIPMFRHVPEPAVRATDLPAGMGPVSASFRQLGATVRELTRYREAF